MATEPTPHTPLPTPPSTDDPTNFDARADAFLPALEVLADEQDATAQEVYDNAVEAYDSATTAGQHKDLAEDWATSTDVVSGGFKGARGYAIDADASADAAAASAASALNAPGTNATSASSQSIGTGSKVFDLVETGKLFTLGQNVVITRTSDATKRMSGPITAFDGSDLTVDVQATAGSGGPYTDWTVALGGVAPAFASQAEAEAGAVNDKTMTPLRVAQAIEVLGRFAPDVIVQDQKSSGTASAVYAASGWRDRELNTVVRNVGSIGTLGSNALTLPAGTWLLRGRASIAYQGGSGAGGLTTARARIYNSTDASVAGQGMNITYTADNSYPGGGVSEVVAIVTIAGAKDFKLQAYHSQNGVQATGLGSGEVEVYATLEATRLTA